jgi:type II secretory pathway pseudopilin PulG
MKITGLKIFVGSITLCVIAGIITAFIVVGLPSTERARRMDLQRVNNLQQITYALDIYYNLKKTIPDDLQSLSGAQDVYIETINDPQTKQPYEYRKLEPTKYELCAVFELAADDTRGQGKFAPPTVPFSGNAADMMWKHAAGRQCFEIQVRTADKTKIP